MNVHDSQFIASELENLGYKETKDSHLADVIVVNTCTVRESASSKIYGYIDSLLGLKRAKNTLKLVVVGCLVSDEHEVKSILEKRRFIDLVLGTRSLHKLGFYLKRLEDEKGPLWDTSLEDDVPEGRTHSLADPYRAYVTITYGCNNFCSYCIVPYVRGRESSRHLSDIVREVQNLADNGVKEITLLGQNVNTYGKGLSKEENFPNLLRALNKIENLTWIRFMTSHPKDFSKEIIDAIAESPKVCHQFHLPMQSGSNKILKDMNRHYDKEHYLAMIAEIRRRFPDAVISTDMIVGYPGETEDDFLETLETVKKASFDAAYTFIYSPRNGTPAAKREDQVPLEIKKERLNRLMEVQNEISLKSNRKLIGKTVKILGEGFSPGKEGMQSGRTQGNRIIHFFAPEKDYNGQFLDITVEDAHTWSMEGRL